MKKEFLFILMGVFLISLAGAQYSVGEPNHSIETRYGPDSSIRGWVNMSFVDQDSGMVFKDNLGNSITLLELFKKNPSLNYECSTQSCVPDYTALNSQSTKSFQLVGNENKTTGIRLDFNVTGIDNIEFNITSTAGESCKNQLKIDFFEDGIIDMANNKSSSQTCSALKDYSCYDSNKASSYFSIRQSLNKHCQRFNLKEAPGFRLGADLQRNGDTREITLELYDLDGDQIQGARCDLPQTSGEVSCDIDYLVTEPQDYYVCIFSDKSTSEIAKIRGYSTQNACGFYWPARAQKPQESAAFSIFIQEKKFAPVQKLEVKNDLGNSLFSQKAFDYLKEKFSAPKGVVDCTKNNCIIPIKLTSSIDQQITLTNLILEYQTNLGPTETNKFYDLNIEAPIITSEFQKIYLDEANFKTPGDVGERKLEFSFSNQLIFEEDISIEEAPIIRSISPQIAAQGFETTFEVSVSSGKNVAEYFWEFGDGESQKTTINKVKHTYNEIKSYTLSVSVTDNSGITSKKSFDIIITSPKNAINETLLEKENDLKELRERIKSFDEFTQNSLEEKLNTTEINFSIQRIRAEFNKVQSNEDYLSIIQKLSGLQVPKNIGVTELIEEIPYFEKKENIDLQTLSLITQEPPVSEEEKYQNAVISWSFNNLDMKITSKEISSFQSPLLKVFTIDIKNKKQRQGPYFLVIKKLDDMRIKDKSNFIEENFYYYLQVSGDTKVVFSTSEEIDYTLLPVFLSPRISDLNIDEKQPQDKKLEFGVLLFILAILILIILAGISYILLQRWYERKYEQYLFKNKNDIYNIVTYIKNSKKSGSSLEDIKKKLVKAGWKKEQINYALKKEAGKNTGMPNIFKIKIGKVNKDSAKE